MYVCAAVLPFIRFSYHFSGHVTVHSSVVHKYNFLFFACVKSSVDQKHIREHCKRDPCWYMFRIKLQTPLATNDALTVIEK